VAAGFQPAVYTVPVQPAGWTHRGATLVLLASCAGGETEPSQHTGDTGPDESFFTNDPAITVSWDAAGVTTVLEEIDTTGFDFGMAETRDPTNGWFGEDCLHGSGGHQECHLITGLAGSVASIHDDVQAGTKTLDDVESGSTTYFDGSFGEEGRLTYVVVVDGGTCWTWGHDPAYYAEWSCEDLP
jgi:hypothetical protein